MRLNHSEVIYLRSRIARDREAMEGLIRWMTETLNLVVPATISITTIQGLVTAARNAEKAAHNLSRSTEIAQTLGIYGEVMGKDSPLEQLGRCADDA